MKRRKKSRKGPPARRWKTVARARKELVPVIVALYDAGAAKHFGVSLSTLKRVVVACGLRPEINARRGVEDGRGNPTIRKPRSRAQIVEALRASGGNVRRATYLLGWRTREWVYVQIRRHGLEPFVDALRGARGRPCRLGSERSS